MNSENPNSQLSNSQPISNAQPGNASFQDRRDRSSSQLQNHGIERRQFSDGHNSLSPDAAELGRAVDQYKLVHRRRYVSYEELLNIIQTLGYSKR